MRREGPLNNHPPLLPQALKSVANMTRVLWMLQDPVVPERLAPKRAAITNDQIDLYNKAAMEVCSLYPPAGHIWPPSAEPI